MSGAASGAPAETTARGSGPRVRGGRHRRPVSEAGGSARRGGTAGTAPGGAATGRRAEGRGGAGRAATGSPGSSRARQRAGFVGPGRSIAPLSPWRARQRGWGLGYDCRKRAGQREGGYRKAQSHVSRTKVQALKDFRRRLQGGGGRVPGPAGPGRPGLRRPPAPGPGLSSGARRPQAYRRGAADRAKALRGPGERRRGLQAGPGRVAAPPGAAPDAWTQVHTWECGTRAYSGE